ncbi:hypothetical protein C2I36_02035 [Rhodobacteraceae bacterium WD3A24]|nr:hypothetical protein C2I36_02035 [Rhodobacteraceae bacterium WD3A24]
MPRAGGGRRILRALLAVALVVSLALSGWNGWQLYRSPAGGLLIDRATAEIGPAMDAALARHATEERIAARLRALLDAQPRNWLAIEAVEAVAAERDIALPDPLAARIDTLRQADHGLLARGGACLSCMWDAGQCTLSTLVACRAPVELTPLGDLAGLARAGAARAAGRDVDEVELALSAVGLAAVAAGPATLGTSLTIKAGAGLGKAAWQMGRISPAMTARLSRAARQGIDWSRLGEVRRPGDLAALIRPGALAPAATAMRAAGRLRTVLGVPGALHVFSRLDTPAEATRAARAAETLGAGTVGRLEILGKARFLRATLRLADEVWWTLGALGAALAALMGLVWSTLASAGLRRARRSAALR